MKVISNSKNLIYGLNVSNERQTVQVGPIHVGDCRPI